jgi:hypothetical protein
VTSQWRGKGGGGGWQGGRRGRGLEGSGWAQGCRAFG